MTILRFEQQVTFLFTRDLAETARFYEEVLRLPLALDQGSCRIYRAGSGFVGFCERADAPREPEGVILTLVAQDVDGWYASLSGKGVRFDGPPKHNERYNIYHCFLTDPNGYTLEIQRFEDPAWPSS